MTNGGTLKIRSTWPTTNQTFTPGAGTVNFSAAGAQTVVARTFNNLTLSGSGVKTLSATSIVNGTLSREGTATTTGTTPTYGPTATLQYKGSAAQTTGIEFPATMPDRTVIVDNSSGVTLGASKSVSGALTLTSGAFSPGAFVLALGAGTQIRRAVGSLPVAPTFTSYVDVVYIGSVGVTTGNEIPVWPATLNSLEIGNSGGRHS